MFVLRWRPDRPSPVQVLKMLLAGPQSAFSEMEPMSVDQEMQQVVSVSPSTRQMLRGEAESDELLAHTSSISDWHADRVEMLLPEHLRWMIVLVRERDSEECAGRKTYVTPGLPHWRALRVGVLTLVELMP